MIALYDKVLGGPVFLDHGVEAVVYLKCYDLKVLAVTNLG